jgi:hypothetical protein
MDPDYLCKGCVEPPHLGDAHVARRSRSKASAPHTVPRDICAVSSCVDSPSLRRVSVGALRALSRTYDT